MKCVHPILCLGISLSAAPAQPVIDTSALFRTDGGVLWADAELFEPASARGESAFKKIRKGDDMDIVGGDRGVGCDVLRVITLLRVDDVRGRLQHVEYGSSSATAAADDAHPFYAFVHPSPKGTEARTCR